MRVLLQYWRGRVIVFIAICGLFAVLGVCGFFLLPAQEGSAAEIMVSSEVTSVNGLAAVQTIDPRRGIEFQNVLQLLSSRAAAEAASSAQYPPESILDHTTLKITPGSGVVRLSVTAQSTADATDILNRILGKAAELDQEKQRQRVDRLIGAVRVRLSQAEDDLKKTNQEISTYLAAQKVTFSIDEERQRSTADLLARYNQNALRIQMANSRLASILEGQDPVMWQAFDADFSDDSGRRTGGSPLEDARRLLDQAKTDAVRLESRYGENHPQVHGAKAALDEATETFQRRVDEEMQRLRLEVKANESALGEITGRSRQAEENFQATDITAKPEYAAMISDRQNLEQLSRELSRRLIELEIYKAASQVSFEVISKPFPSRSRSLKAFLAIVSLSILSGGVVGLAVLYAFTRRVQTDESHT